MAIDLEADLDAIFENGDFDTDAVFTISTGPTVTLTVSGWFTKASEAAPFPGGEIEAINPMFDCATSAIVTVDLKMSVAINAVNYIVERIQDNGTGISTVHLKTKRA